MKLAEVYNRHPEVSGVPKWLHLIPACVAGMILVGVMGWMGFPWKLYNDIPSLVGYTALALMLYKLGVNPINEFFCFTNEFSYEWYLTHIFVFQIIMYLLGGKAGAVGSFFACLSVSYFTAYWYGRLWKIRLRCH